MLELDADTRAVLVTMYATYLVSVSSPGPNVLLMLRAVAVEEKYANVLALGLGLASGTGVWLVATYFGLTALLARSQGALLAIQAVGVVFFSCIAWSLLAPRKKHDPSAAKAESLPKRRSPLSRYATGVAFNLSNAGTALFFVTLFGPVVARIPSGPGLAAVSLSIFVLSCGWQLLISSLYFAKSTRAAALVRALNGQLARAAFGVCFLGVTVKMAANLIHSL